MHSCMWMRFEWPGLGEAFACAAVVHGRFGFWVWNNAFECESSNVGLAQPPRNSTAVVWIMMM